MKNTNTLLEKIAEEIKADRGAAPGFAEMKRSFGWEFDGMRLHEVDFESLAKEAKKLPASGSLVFEHAFLTDYGLKRAEYIEAFVKAVSWKRVSERFAEASKEAAVAVR